MRLSANWNYPTAVRFGAGRIAELADAVRRPDGAAARRHRSRTLATLPMVAATLCAALTGRDSGWTVRQVRPNPVEANVEAGRRRLPRRRP